MGIGIRLFFFDDNSVKRFSVAKFQRLWNGNVNEKIPQYTGKMIKYAMVIVETENDLKGQKNYLLKDFHTK